MDWLHNPVTPTFRSTEFRVVGRTESWGEPALSYDHLRSQQHPRQRVSSHVPPWCFGSSKALLYLGSIRNYFGVRRRCDRHETAIWNLVKQPPLDLSPTMPPRKAMDESDGSSVDLQEDRFSTPSSRETFKTQTLSSKSKRRVKLADPNGGERCLITNAADAINFCHCIPRRTKRKKSTVGVYKIHHYLF